MLGNNSPTFSGWRTSGWCARASPAHLHGYPCGQHETASSVAIVVQPDSGQPARHHLLDEPLRNGVRVARTAHLVGEDVATVLLQLQPSPISRLPGWP